MANQVSAPYIVPSCRTNAIVSIAIGVRCTVRVRLEEQSWKLLHAKLAYPVHLYAQILHCAREVQRFLRLITRLSFEDAWLKTVLMVLSTATREQIVSREEGEW